MGWKEFFKFTKRKIIAEIILIVLSLIAGLGSMGFGVKPPLWSQLIIYLLISPPMFLLISLWTFIYSNYGISMSTISHGNAWGGIVEFIMGLLLVLVYQYVLVCIFDWIVVKVKAKK